MPEDTPPRRLVFRIPGTALLALLILVICSSAAVLVVPWLAVVYVLPVLAGVWLVRARTTADADGLVVRGLTRSRRLPWDSLAGLKLANKKWVRAVLTDGSEVVLPAVRVFHLPALALVSGGRLSDPTEVTPADVAAEDEVTSSPDPDPE
jgi:hypothetical protein